MVVVHANRLVFSIFEIATKRKKEDGRRRRRGKMRKKTVNKGSAVL